MRARRLNRRTVLLTAAATAWPVSRALASFEQKHALLIGNKAYKDAIGRPLLNTIKDVTLIAGALREQAFEAARIVVQNDMPTAEAFLAAVDTFVARLKQAGPDALGYFHYCGHGVGNQDDRNFLIPTGVENALTPAFWTQSLDVQTLFERLGRHTGPMIVVLDCCRAELDLPAPAQPAPSPVPSRGAVAPVSKRVEGRGLCAVQRLQPPNMFICYSAWEGEAASDGLDGATNGPFAIVLNTMLRGLRQRTTQQIFKQTQLGVVNLPGSQQQPQYVDRFDGPATNARFFGEPKASTRIAPKVRQTLALVVANGHSGTALKRPAAGSDVALVGAALTRCGYKVDTVMNTTRKEFFAALDRFTRKLKAGGSEATGLVFLSGYGVGVNRGFVDNHLVRENFIVPNDLLPWREAELTPATYIAIGDIVSRLAATGARSIALIKDVNRLISRDFNQKGSFGWESLGQDLQRDNRNLMIVHSAGERELSLDNATGSIFAQSLARTLPSAARLSLQQAMNRIQQDVYTQTQGAQTPWLDPANDLPVFFADEG